MSKKSTIRLIVGLLLVSGAVLFFVLGRGPVNNRATKPDPLQHLAAKLAQFDKPNFTEDETRQFNREILVPILNHAMRVDSIEAVREDIRELYGRYRQRSLLIIISPDFFIRNGYEYREVGGQTVPKERSDSEVDEVYVYLKSWQESGHLDNIYRLNDVVITNLCHELEHVRSKDRQARGSERAVDEEVRVWLSQIERILLLFYQTGRYLTESQKDAITVYQSTQEPERETRFRRWVETSAAFTAYQRP